MPDPAKERIKLFRVIVSVIGFFDISVIIVMDDDFFMIGVHAFYLCFNFRGKFLHADCELRRVTFQV